MRSVAERYYNYTIWNGRAIWFVGMLRRMAFGRKLLCISFRSKYAARDTRGTVIIPSAPTT